MKRTANWSWADSAWGAVVRLNTSVPAERVVMALPKVDTTAVDERGVPTVVSSPGPAEGLLQRGLQRIGTVDLGMPRSGHASRTASSSQGVGNARSASPEATRRALQASEDGAHPANAGEHPADHTGAEVPAVKEAEETGITDAEGWIYTDNKWETPAPKNGIGKVCTPLDRSLQTLTICL